MSHDVTFSRHILLEVDSEDPEGFCNKPPDWSGSEAALILLLDWFCGKELCSVSFY